jgi:hypothetical protein
MFTVKKEHVRHITCCKTFADNYRDILTRFSTAGCDKLAKTEHFFYLLAAKRPIEVVETMRKFTHA